MVERAARALDVTEDIHIIKGFFNESLPGALLQGHSLILSLISIAHRPSLYYPPNRLPTSSSFHSFPAFHTLIFTPPLCILCFSVWITYINLEGIIDPQDGHFFSIIRLDGDLYQSTIESLHYLYPLLSIGGFLVIDDYTDWKVIKTQNLYNFNFPISHFCKNFASLLFKNYKYPYLSSLLIAMWNNWQQRVHSFSLKLSLLFHTIYRVRGMLFWITVQGIESRNGLKWHGMIWELIRWEASKHALSGGWKQKMSIMTLYLNPSNKWNMGCECDI